MKPKTIRAIEPNAGMQKKLEAKLVAFSNALVKAAAQQVFADLISSGDLVDEPIELAQDELPKISAAERKLLEKTQKVLRTGMTSTMARQRISKSVADRLARWLISIEENARDVSKWFVRSTARDVTSSQRKALLDAGISPEFLRQKWSVPVLKRQFISARAAERLPMIVDDMTGLITKMASDDLSRLQDVITEGLVNGQNMERIEQTLFATSGFTAARAKRVALDQSIKISDAIQRENAKEIGVTEGIWVHVPGRYSSRKTHIAMNGKKFKLSEGLYDSAVGHNVTPGSEPFCRCIFRSVLPPELLGK